MSSSRSSPRTRIPAPSSRALFIVPSLVIAAMVAACVIGVLATTTGPAPVFKVTPIIEYGLPVMKGLTNLATATTIGGLLLATLILPRTSPGYGYALDVSACGALVWTVSAAAATVLTFLSVAGTVPPEIFGPSLGQFLTQIELGRAWLATVLAASALTLLCFAVRNQTAVAFVMIAAFAAMVPVSLQGHAAGAGSHTAAASALWLHVAASAAWIGGLLALVLTHRRVPEAQASNALTRYSSIALVSFIVLTTAGTVGAALRLQSPEQLLTTDWGRLLSGKVVLLLALGVLGAYYRTRLLTKPARPSAVRSRIWRLVIVELAIMGGASGFATVLSRTSPPVVEQIANTPSQRLTGQDLPLPFSPLRVLDAWSLDPVWLLVAGLGIAAYIRAVVQLRRRGEPWPTWRGASWVVGMVLLYYVTSGAPNVYSPYLITAQTVGQGVLILTVPLLLVLSAPTSLLLRAARPRSDGSRGVREWAVLVVQSRVAAVATHPIVTVALFACSMILLYTPTVLRWVLEDPVGQQWATAQFLLVGILFCQSILETGQEGRGNPYPLRLMALLVALVSLTIFGLTLLTRNDLLLPSWYGIIAEGWEVDPLSAQQAAGVTLWAVVTLPALILTAILGYQWTHADREQFRNRPETIPGWDGHTGANVPATPSRDRHR